VAWDKLDLTYACTVALLVLCHLPVKGDLTPIHPAEEGLYTIL